MAVALSAAGPAASATIDPLSPTTLWTPLPYPSSTPDPANDQGTGDSEGDIVGNVDDPALYILFDNAGTPSATDGNIAFRVRLAEDSNPAGFGNFLLVGLDGDADGALDLILGVDFKGNPDELGIYLPGSDLNVSPSTTSIVTPPSWSYAPTASNYSWAAVDNTIDPGVTNTDLDGGGETDHFLSFVIPFGDVVSELASSGMAVDDSTEFRYVAGTGQQPNALNQDVGGPSDGWSSQLPWDQLGAISIPFAPSRAPEPDTFLLTALGLLILSSRRRSRRV